MPFRTRLRPTRFTSWSWACALGLGACIACGGRLIDERGLYDDDPGSPSLAPASEPSPIPSNGGHAPEPAPEPSPIPSNGGDAPEPPGGRPPEPGPMPPRRPPPEPSPAEDDLSHLTPYLCFDSCGSAQDCPSPDPYVGGCFPNFGSACLLTCDAGCPPGTSRAEVSGGCICYLEGISASTESDRCCSFSNCGPPYYVPCCDGRCIDGTCF
jgi:hypothetical protein